ncbi:MAG: hypothetical protein QCH99_07560 [Candidatus Bathyarchaeota archaeon]|nr:hypothetical protein [Candidatus Bathyarchaeum tardum]WGM90266.1 MAG: hypothetical protein NUK63_03875 [Candidatus Bathyarchaeum tardum]
MDNYEPKVCNGDLQEKDVTVIQAIQEEKLTNFSFEGLKRRLVMHPETLSRTLNRLMEQNLIKKEPEGYALTTKTTELFKDSYSVQKTGLAMNVLQTLLPKEQVTQKVVSNLKGRWFGTLRWLGYSEANGETMLKWITEDGETIISAVFGQEKLKINAKVLSKNHDNSVLIATNQLMGNITKLMSNSLNN